MKRHHVCIVTNRNAYKQNMLALKAIVDALEGNEMRDEDRQSLAASVEAGYARAKELIGNLIGMHLQWQPENEAFNKSVENYLGEGGNYEHVADGMKAMSKEMKKQQQEAEAEARSNQPANEASTGDDPQHRSRYTNFLLKNYSAGTQS